ncbi:MAG: hypothetical protein LBN95_06190 [Prevotellaceae bacterium]|jgi:hypothetical protein|nr:hypothetical protein [Prevotellaceae bacterium]
MKKSFFLLTILFVSAVSFAQTENDSVKTETKAAKFFKGLTLGGYGEVAYSRNFYSDNIHRYSHAEDYRNAPSHGRFDIPHVVVLLGYEFGKGWRFSSEIEFEHGGTEVAIELETEEAGEYESEIERGGEIVLEQFWIEKTFSKALNLRFGHIIVPVGFTNMHHLPTEFFTVYRPEGENTIFPCTWHETGISLWGKTKGWRYEAAFLPALSSEMFNNKNWANGASASPYEFRVANKYAGAARIDNYSVKGLRLGLSGYYGHTFNNSIQPTTAEKYKNVKGQVVIGSFDFHYQNYGFTARGYFDYGHLSDAEIISVYNKSLQKNSPFPRTNVASDVLVSGIEAGFDFFSLSNNQKLQKQQFFLFGRYDFYDSMYKTSGSIQKDGWSKKQILTAGINYYPIKQVAIKAEYSYRKLQQPYNSEPSINIGVVYAGMFK